MPQRSHAFGERGGLGERDQVAEETEFAPTESGFQAAQTPNPKPQTPNPKPLVGELVSTDMADQQQTKAVSSPHQFALVIGDLHVSSKCAGLPDKFREILVGESQQKPGGIITHVLCLGNVGDNSHLQRLKSLSPNFTMVLGDCDNIAGVPARKKIDIHGVKLGLVHGHQVPIA